MSKHGHCQSLVRHEKQLAKDFGAWLHHKRKQQSRCHEFNEKIELYIIFDRPFIEWLVVFGGLGLTA